MKILVSHMADLKLRLLEKIVQTRHRTLVVDTLSNQRIEPDKMTVCQAVEDRICKRIDLASRTDLTDRQAEWTRFASFSRSSGKSDLPVDFSPAEILLLTRRRIGEIRREGDRSA